MPNRNGLARISFMNEWQRKSLFLAIILSTVCVFIFDLLYPVGIEVWVLYLPAILIPAYYNSARQIVFVGVMCSTMVIIGTFISPLGHNPVWWDWLNRSFGLMAIWLVTLTGNLICRHAVRLTETVSELNQAISKQILAEQALRENEERLRLAMHGGGMGTRDANLVTSQEVWSETLFKILGYEPVRGGNATREMWLQRIHPDDVRRTTEMTNEARDKNSLLHLEYRICHPDGKKISWIETFGLHYYDDQGVAVRFIGVCFDITRRKELEHEVLEVSAHEQNQIGQELHDGVGQELTGLGLMSQSLAQRLPEASAEKRIASRLMEGLDQVHQRIRELSRGLIPVHVEARGLYAALEDLADRTSKQAGISVTSDCPEWVKEPDHATSVQMFRIAQEAVSNALRHGKPQNIRITLLAEPDGLRLRIKDDGKGMIKQPEECMGLGLRIMQYRTDLIGGILNISSAEGGGTIVTCTLPRSVHHE